MIITICNHKGGVAKTVTAYHLAAAAARRGLRPLLIDLDPQANLTRMCGGRRPGNPTVGDLLGGAHPPTATLHIARQYISFDSSACGYLLPADIGLENVAVGLMQRDFGRLTALRSAIERSDDWPLIIIDTPPTAAILTLNALVASTHVLFCADPEPDAIAGVNRMVDVVRQILGERGEAPAILGTLATRVNQQLTRHHDGLDALVALGMPALLGLIPLRAGQDAERHLIAAYAPIADQLLLEAGLEEGGDHARPIAA